MEQAFGVSGFNRKKDSLSILPISAIKYVNCVEDEGIVTFQNFKDFIKPFSVSINISIKTHDILLR